MFAQAARPGVAGDFPLAVPYVVTATSLEKNQERYFLFVRDGEQRESLGDEIWFNIASDGRWLTVREYSGKDLRAAAFASGSPFPVFSSHQVELAQLRINEQLIDGGFAHNRPLDAARMLGASKVLVLNSSPLEAASNGSCGPAAWIKVGELSCNVPKLLPYLWSRSQVEDSLSSARMLVASIYPTADDEAEQGAWPMLTDFRGAVVDRMIAAADHDLLGRVATIESWGAPQLSDARLLPVSNLLLMPLSKGQ
jgi:predicted acylesterase/phospholipase RssA